MLFVLFTMTMHAQIEPIYKYDYSNLDDEYPGYITYTIKGKKYYDYGKIFLKGKDTIFQVETEDIVHYSLYKKGICLSHTFRKNKKVGRLVLL